MRFLQLARGLLFLCAVLVALLAMAGLLPGADTLGAPGPVPMSPLSAILVVVLGVAGLLVEGPRRSALARTAHALALLAALLSLGLLVLRLSGTLLPLERWLTQVRPGSVVTSPLTALAMLGAALSCLCRWGGHEPARGRRQAGAALALLTFGIGLLGFVAYVAGGTVLYGPGQIPISLPSVLGALFLGLALVLAAGQDTWPMAAFSASAYGDVPAAPSGLALSLSALFLALGLLVLGGGALYLRRELGEARNRAHSELATIGGYKSRQITAWYEERRAEAEWLLRGGLIQNQLRRYLADSPLAPSRAELLSWMEGLCGEASYRRVALYDAQGRLRLAVPAAADPGADLDVAELQGALRSREVQAWDLHQHPGHPDIHLSFWIPVGTGSGAQAQGALLLLLDPRQFLFPLVASWPNASRTAETVLVRREGEEVLYLSDLRHGGYRAMTLRQSLAAHPGLPAVLAVQGQEGLVEGKDYRGVPVDAVLHRIPGTAWRMVAKVDEAEIYSPLRGQIWTGGVGLLGLVVLIGTGIGLLLRQHDAAMVRRQLELSQRFEWLMQEANDIILLLDGEGRVLEANTRAIEHYGYTLPELRGLRVPDLRAPEALGEAPDPFLQVKQQGSSRYETVHRQKDGGVFPVEVSARAVELDGELWVIAFIRDITERRAQEREISRMTRLYASLSQVSQAIAWSDDRQSLFDRSCKALVVAGGFDMAWVGLLDPLSSRVAVAASHGDDKGYLQRIHLGSEDSLLGIGPAGMAIQEDCPCVVNDFMNAAETEPWHEAARASGFGSVAAFPIHRGHEVVGALSVNAREREFFGTHEAAVLMDAAADLSHALDHLESEARRTEAETALLENRRFLTEAQEAGRIGTFTWFIQEDRWRGGPFLHEIFGIDDTYPGDLEGWIRIVAPEFREIFRTYSARILENKERFDLDYPIVRVQDGARRWVHGQGEVRRDAEGRPVALAGILQDITEQRQAQEERRSLEAQLHQSQKLESLGSLAGGVAHDMNNVLGAVLGLASTMREAEDPFSPEARNLETIINACMRGRSVVKSLLYFAQKDLQEERPTDLNLLAREITELLGHTTLKRVQLNLDLQAGIGLVRGDAGALSHALMNLCVNALDAMPGGGELHLQTEHTLEGGVSLRVRDTGAGMAPEVLVKAMEPFFTTKPIGKGTGLGLAMVYGTMKAHDGTFELRSQPGQGTEAILHFPPSRVIRSAAAPGHQPPGFERSRNALRILLVDDDELIRESVVPLLEVLGHEITAVPGGLQALRLLEGDQPVDLVVLDMNMPGMTGAEALPRILALRPELHVLLATGYSDQEIAPLMEGRPRVCGIRKPFSLREVQRKIDGLGITRAAGT